MAQEIRIPKLGLTMTEATLVQWMVGAGESVVEEQIICVIETDKVSFEMPSPGTGLLHPVVEPGRCVQVGELIGYVADSTADLDELQTRFTAAGTGPVGEVPIEVVEKAIVNEPVVGQPCTAPMEKPVYGERIPASPAARKLSRVLGIELSNIFGSGPGGRIILKDVEKAAETVQRERMDTRYNFGSAARETEMLTVAEQIPIRGIRKIIFKNMKLSVTSQAQLTLHTEASAKDLSDLRHLFNTRQQNQQPRMSYNAIMVKAVALTLRLYPMLNASVDDHQIKIWKQIHIGVAMDLGYGLIVPKVRNADTKSLPIISDELNDLVIKAEKKKLLPDELSGGTFTITNLGNWDIDHFTPIVNFPESAILGVGRIIEKPWVRHSVVIAEPRVALSLTFDHRIIDGNLAAQFLKTLKHRIEESRLML